MGVLRAGERGQATVEAAFLIPVLFTVLLLSVQPGMVLYEVYTTVYITPRAGLEEQLKRK